MRKRTATTVADIEGEWTDPDFNSGLIECCKSGTNELLCIYLREKIALGLILPEAKKRLADGYTDNTEMYGEELENAIKHAEESV